MKMFDKYILREAAFNSSKRRVDELPPAQYRQELIAGEWLDRFNDSFFDGASYAQQHIEDVCVGFAIFCDDNYEEGSTNFKSLFQEYIKQTSK